VSRIAELEAEVIHWKANHADMVKRQKLLIDRPDMPLVRVRAYELVTKTCQENVDLLGKLHDTEILLRDILEFGDVGYGLAERIKQHIILIKREQKQ
jgi:hypothetical protein